MKRAIAIALLLLLACARTSATREQWQQMSDEEKTLYVRSLLGHEKAAERKGGNDRAYDRPPQEYVAKIDEAYARGEQRGVDELFASLGRPH